MDPSKDLEPTRQPLFSQEDIRIFLADYIENNRLIGRLEFSPERIQNAAIYCIRQFNETPPPLSVFPEDPNTFPFPHLLMIGTIGHLLLGKSLEKDRNRLAYTTDGVNVDDEAMSDTYRAVAQLLRQEFKDSLKSIKISMNLESGYGQVPSEYGRRYLFRGDFIR